MESRLMRGEREPQADEVRYTTARFELPEVSESIERIAALGDEAHSVRAELQEEIHRLQAELADLRKELERAQADGAALQRFAEIGRREYEALRREAHGKVSALLLHHPDDEGYTRLRERLDRADGDYEEVRRVHARAETELHERYATRPEAAATELRCETDLPESDWSAYRLNP